MSEETEIKQHNEWVEKQKATTEASVCSNGLLGCPFCGGKVRWCGDDPENPHDCHHINCPDCEYNFDLNNDQVQYACNLDSAKLEVTRVWNKRAG